VNKGSFYYGGLIMTTSKKLLFASAFIATCMTQAVSMDGFDTHMLNPYITRAQEALDNAANELEDSINKQGGLLWHGPTYAELLYPQQKTALKAILKELKDNITDDKDASKTARQLYKAFKYNVYKSWKKTGIITGNVTNTIVGHPKKTILILE
jgi:hypothetical protein